MKVQIIFWVLLLGISILSGCTVQPPSNMELTEDTYMDYPVSDSTVTNSELNAEASKPEVMESELQLTVNGVSCEVIWENNETVAEIFSYAQGNLITVNTTAYGGFEQVGSLPQSFSRNDTQMTTQPGDIVLYSGNQLVVFFGSNSWSYTKLGHINLSADKLNELLSADTGIIEIYVR